MSQAALNEKLAERKDSVFFVFCGILRVKPLQGFFDNRNGWVDKDEDMISGQIMATKPPRSPQKV